MEISVQLFKNNNIIKRRKEVLLTVFDNETKYSYKTVSIEVYSKYSL